MRKYCNIVKNKLNFLIRNMEKNSSTFVADPKRDFVRKSGTSSAGKLEITAFSGGVSKVVVDVTPYNSDGIAGDTVSATYVPGSGGSNNNKTVTSCTKFGTIYSPSGSKVDGLTRSYLIDCGAATYDDNDQ